MDVDSNDAFSLNEAELMEYYNLKGLFGKFRLRLFVLKNWIFHSLSYFSPHFKHCGLILASLFKQFLCYFCQFDRLIVSYNS